MSAYGRVGVGAWVVSPYYPKQGGCEGRQHPEDDTPHADTFALADTFYPANMP